MTLRNALNLTRLIVASLLGFAALVFGVCKAAITVIGATTTPDDYALLVARMPKFMNWLFATPWPVPTLVFLSVCALSAWLFWSGTRKTVEDEIASHPHLSPEMIREIVADALAQQPQPEVRQPSRENRNLDAVVGYLRGIELIKIHKQLEDGIEVIWNDFCDPQGKDMNAGWAIRERFNSFESKLGILGIDVAALRERTSVEETRITADAAYLTLLNDSEKESFANGYEKRNWYIFNARFSAIRDAIKNASPPLMSGSEFVNRLI
jgi:hypothetical protein